MYILTYIVSAHINVQAVICSCYGCESSSVLLHKVCMCFLIHIYTDSLTTCAVELNAGSPSFIKWELENFEASKR